MTAKQSALIEEFVNQINPEYRNLYRSLAEYAVSYGYTPSRCKTSDLTIDFKNNKLKKTIMKFTLQEERHDGFGYGERDVPGLRLCWFAATEYSEKFHAAIKRVIEEFDGKYTGCYGCGYCKGMPQGYTYTYPDGRKVFRCGRERISVFNITETDLPEIKRLMDAQAQYDVASIK